LKEVIAVKNSGTRRLVLGIAIGVVAYVALIAGYFLLVLRPLGEPLKNLFVNNLILYAFVALALVVAQGVLLAVVTSFLVNRLGLEQLE
jgi:hypothetical protein